MAEIVSMSTEYRSPYIDPRYYQHREWCIERIQEARAFVLSPLPEPSSHERDVTGTVQTERVRRTPAADIGPDGPSVPELQSGDDAGKPTHPPAPWRNKRERPKYIERMNDRHGQPRYAFHRRPSPRVMLPGQPQEPEFESAYRAALWADNVLRQRSLNMALRDKTCAHLIDLYVDSPAFENLAPNSKAAYTRVLRRFALDPQFGPRKVSDLTKANIRHVISARSGPASVNDALKKMRLLMRFAVELGWRTNDPTIGLAAKATGSSHAWTGDEIRQFEARWPIGTRERTVFTRMLHDGMRACDVATDQDRTPVLTCRGRPFSAAGLGHFMARANAEAGLPPRCTPQGLRKNYKIFKPPESNGPKSKQRNRTYFWDGPRPEGGHGRVLSLGQNRPCDRAPQARVSAHAGDAPSAKCGKLDRRRTRHGQMRPLARPKVSQGAHATEQ